VHLGLSALDRLRASGAADAAITEEALTGEVSKLLGKEIEESEELQNVIGEMCVFSSSFSSFLTPTD
jgi:hypothetical protein